MIIKISKSQLINILNEEENSLSPEDKFTLLDAGLESLASNSDDPAIAALGDMIISSQKMLKVLVVVLLKYNTKITQQSIVI